MEEINRDCSKCYKLYSSCGWVGKDCQYKNNPEILNQLKQKEKEIEELKAEMIQGNQLYYDRIVALNELNEELKAQKTYLITGGDELLEENKKLRTENEKLKQALQEIKEKNNYLERKIKAEIKENMNKKIDKVRKYCKNQLKKLIAIYNWRGEKVCTVTEHQKVCKHILKIITSEVEE